MWNITPMVIVEVIKPRHTVQVTAPKGRGPHMYMIFNKISNPENVIACETSDLLLRDSFIGTYG